MLCSLNHHQDITARENIKSKLSFLPFEELTMDNGDLLTKLEYFLFIYFKNHIYKGFVH